MASLPTSEPYASGRSFPWTFVPFATGSFAPYLGCARFASRLPRDRGPSDCRSLCAAASAWPRLGRLCAVRSEAAEPGQRQAPGTSGTHRGTGGRGPSSSGSGVTADTTGPHAAGHQAPLIPGTAAAPAAPKPAPAWALWQREPPHSLALETTWTSTPARQSGALCSAPSTPTPRVCLAHRSSAPRTVSTR